MSMMIHRHFMKDNKTENVTHMADVVPMKEQPDIVAGDGDLIHSDADSDQTTPVTPRRGRPPKNTVSN